MVMSRKLLLIYTIGMIHNHGGKAFKVDIERWLLQRLKHRPKPFQNSGYAITDRMLYGVACKIIKHRVVAGNKRHVGAMKR